MTTSDTSDPSYLRQKIKSDQKRFERLTRLREVVFGAQDGIISTVAVTTAVALIGVPLPIVLVTGLTAAITGMVSMGIGSFLGSHTEKSVEQAEIERERRELKRNPQRKQEELLLLEKEQGYTEDVTHAYVNDLSKKQSLLVSTLLSKKLGIVDAISTKPLLDATTMAISFIISALVTLIPYLLFGVTTLAIGSSIALSLVSLFILGVCTGFLIKKAPVIQGGIVLGIGTASATIAFIIGELVPKLFT